MTAFAKALINTVPVYVHREISRRPGTELLKRGGGGLVPCQRDAVDGARMRHGNKSKSYTINSLLLRSLTSRILLLLGLSLVGASTGVSAMDFSLGAGAVESGDDRPHGIAIAGVGFANQWTVRGYLWGRTQRPVTETNTMLTVAKRHDVFSGKIIQVSTGLTVLAERTEIKFADYPEDNDESTSTNAGLQLGVSWDILASGPFKVTASWEGHLFPAGGAALLLVTGRKQVIGLTGGIAL
jgi:hypothetical protein